MGTDRTAWGCAFWIWLIVGSALMLRVAHIFRPVPLWAATLIGLAWGAVLIYFVMKSFEGTPPHRPGP